MQTMRGGKGLMMCEQFPVEKKEKGILALLKRFWKFCTRTVRRLVRPLIFLAGYASLFAGIFKEYNIIRTVTYNTSLLFLHAPDDLSSPDHAPKDALISLVSHKFEESKYSESLNTLFTPVSWYNLEVLQVLLLIVIGYFLIRWTAPLRYARIPWAGLLFFPNPDSIRERYLWWSLRWAGYLLVGYMLAQLVYLLTY